MDIWQCRYNGLHLRQGWKRWQKVLFTFNSFLFLLLFKGSSKYILGLYYLWTHWLCVALKLSLVRNANICHSLWLRNPVSTTSRILWLREMHRCEGLDSLRQLRDTLILHELWVVVKLSPIDQILVCRAYLRQSLIGGIDDFSADLGYVHFLGAFLVWGLSNRSRIEYLQVRVRWHRWSFKLICGCYRHWA